MKNITLVLVLVFSIPSYCQIKFKAYESYEDSHSFFVDDTTNCNISIIADDSKNQIRIISEGNETIYNYESAEINRPLFFEDDEKVKNKVKYDFVVHYINVEDKYNDNKCIIIYKLKKKQENKSIYLIKIQKSLHRSIIYKAKLIEGGFPE